MTDLHDAKHVAEGVAAWATQQFAAPVVVTQSAQLTGGMDNFVHAFMLHGDTLPAEWRHELVVRVRPSVDGFEHLAGESAVQQWCFERGYPAAQILATIHPEQWSIGHPAQICVRARGSNVLDAFKASPRSIRSLIRAQAELHVELHALDTAAFPSSIVRRGIADHRLGDVDREIARGHDELRAPLTQIRAALQQLPAPDTDRTVCHGDFHPLNVLVDLDDPARPMTIIAWPDATFDDRHADVARSIALLQCAAVASASRLERTLLRVAGPILASMYRRAYQRKRPIDERRLYVYIALHVLSGLAQIASLQNVDVESASAGREFDPTITKMLNARLHRTVRKLERKSGTITRSGQPSAKLVLPDPVQTAPGVDELAQ